MQTLRSKDNLLKTEDQSDDYNCGSGAQVTTGPSVLVSPNPITTIAGPSGSLSAGGGAVLGGGISVTTSGAVTITFGVGAGAELGTSPQFGTSQFIPFCHN
jgi:hypothetical protein